MKRSNIRSFASLFFVLLAIVPASSVEGSIISGTWNFSIAGGFSGSFSLTNLDNTQSYLNSTAAGLTVSTNFSRAGDGGDAINYSPSTDILQIGGLVGGVSSVIFLTNDWRLRIDNISTNPTFSFFEYGPAGGDFVQVFVGTVTPAAVPEPATLALLGLGLGGLALTRRRRSN